MGRYVQLVGEGGGGACSDVHAYMCMAHGHTPQGFIGGGGGEGGKSLGP